MSSPLDPQPEEADVRDVAAAVEEGGATLVDVREDWEWQGGRVDGARHIPMAELPAHLDELPRDEPLYLICHSGNRSGRVASWLKQNGFERPINVRGGMVAWERAGLPVSRRP